jgi:hypothetical protein
VRVDWQELRLSQSVADGYGEAARPIDQLLQDVVASRKDALPAVVWIYDLEDEKQNSALETKIFNDLKVGIALKRFVCLKGNIETIPNAKLADDLRKQAPVFFFYDPAVKSFTQLVGKRAASRSRFYGAVEKLWSASFQVKLGEFTGKMSKILDGIDKIEKEKELLAAKRSRAEGNPGKLRSIARDEEKLKEEEKAVLEDEQKLLADCRLRDEYASGAPEAAAK